MLAIEGAAKFLNGQADEIVQTLDEEMAQAADAWNFERAAELRDRINAINHVLERQKIVSPNRDNADVIAMAKGEGGAAGVQVGFLRSGRLLGSEFFPMQARVEDSAPEILASFVSQFYADAAVVRPQLILEDELPSEERDFLNSWRAERRGAPVSSTVPKRVRKRELVTMV